MAARRSKPAGLTDDEVAALREQLAAGRRPRVQLSGPQFGEDAIGTVSRIGDPDTVGSDYITVKVKVNGTADELAFAPAELQLPGRRSRTAVKAAPAKKASSRTPHGAAMATSNVSTPAAAPRKTPAATPAVPEAVPTTSNSAAPAKAAQVPAAPAKVAPAPAGRRRKAGALPKVTLTVQSAGASWTVSATRGNKAVLKNAALAPGAVTAVAELLGQPSLIEAVAEINDTALHEAQARAEQLRAELDQLEAVLATHRGPR